MVVLAVDVATVVHVYATHSEQQCSRHPFTGDSLARLSTPEIDPTSAQIYCSKEDTSRMLDFSISMNDATSPEVFTWGSLDQATTTAHLTKFINSATIQDFTVQGYGVIEHEYRLVGPEHAGPTKFYRCMDGRAVPDVWIHKEVVS